MSLPGVCRLRLRRIEGPSRSRAIEGLGYLPLDPLGDHAVLVEPSSLFLELGDAKGGLEVFELGGWRRGSARDEIRACLGSSVAIDAVDFDPGPGFLVEAAVPVA